MGIKIDRMVLDKDEAAWFVRNVNKMLQLLEASEAKNPGVQSRSSYVILKSMKEKAEDIDVKLKAFGDEPFELDLILSRKQKLMLRGMLQTAERTLLDKVIPEYEKRGEDYSEYKQAALDKAERIKKLMRKLKP